MNKYSKLISNSIVFTIGNFGSKLINFLLVPLYTSYLSTSEYGTADLMTTTRNFLLPFLTLEIGQAALRFAVENNTEKDHEELYSNLVIHGAAISLLIGIGTGIFYSLNYLDINSILFVFLIIFSMFNNMLSQYIRGIGLVKQFAFNGILTTIITVISNLILLLHYNSGIYGYLLSMILALIGSNAYIIYEISKKINFLKISPRLQKYKEMLVFSVPIIPTSSMWWLINGSTRYIILFFLDTSANGLFAIANKIPSIISMIISLFSQSWQLSSFEEYESDDKDVFYSNIFNSYSSILFIISSIIMVFLKPVYSIIIDASFYSSWKISPFLILAVIYQGFSSFLGTNYTASKQTKGAFTTSIYGGIISIVSSFVFIPLFGIIGAGLSSLLSFLGMFVIRIIDTRKYVKIKINYKIFILNNVVFLIQTTILFYFENVSLIVIQILLFLLLLIINRNVIQLLVDPILKRIKK